VLDSADPADEGDPGAVERLVCIRSFDPVFFTFLGQVPT